MKAYQGLKLTVGLGLMLVAFSLFGFCMDYMQQTTKNNITNAFHARTPYAPEHTWAPVGFTLFVGVVTVVLAIWIIRSEREYARYATANQQRWDKIHAEYDAQKAASREQARQFIADADVLVGC